MVRSRSLAALAALAALCAAAPPAATSAVTLKLKSTKKPYAGVTVRHYTTTSPTTRLWLAEIDLCAAQVHIDATKPTSSLSTAGSWGAKVGALLATNGDFYKTGPVRVYGQSAGLGQPWPDKQTGAWAGYAGQWYYKDYGWLAFGHDRVWWSHSGHSKKNAAKLGLTSGWSPTKFTHAIPAGAVGLVSGFPQLVVEGKQVTCSSPTAASCFPDRSDMRARHPRTAMGLTADQKHLLLLVVDGRTSKSKGMYGAELAEVMKKFGAWQAFNLDGGGSSQMWLAGTGYLNDVKGNNNGGAVRSVANHWGLLVKDRPKRPGHCQSAAPCGVVPAAGGVVDDGGPCFIPFGPMKYWRSEKKGHAGGLRWTNAFSGSVAGNWAWWRLHLAEAGEYKVEYRAEKAWAVHTKTRYQVRAAGKTHMLTVDQSKGATWRTLGTWAFAKGGLQWVSIWDVNGGSVSKDQRIVADAIRLTRVGAWCGNTQCDGKETCSTCTKDCGPCSTCGDGQCNATENCSTCSKDCGPCPTCGDGKCDATESCGSCEKDCGPCVICGDGKCDGAETCAGCPKDCGPCDAADGGAGDTGPGDAGSPGVTDTVGGGASADAASTPDGDVSEDASAHVVADGWARLPEGGAGSKDDADASDDAWEVLSGEAGAAGDGSDIAGPDDTSTHDAGSAPGDAGAAGRRADSLTGDSTAAGRGTGVGGGGCAATGSGRGQGAGLLGLAILCLLCARRRSATPTLRDG